MTLTQLHHHGQGALRAPVVAPAAAVTPSQKTRAKVVAAEGSEGCNTPIAAIYLVCGRRPSTISPSWLKKKYTDE
jgi:hypothetical protein